MMKKVSAGSPSRIRYSSSVKVLFWAQPAISARWSSDIPSNAGASASSCSTVCTDPPLLTWRRRTEVGCADRGGLLGDVDRHRAPGDAAPAADAAGGPELVDPGGELVGHPLAVARGRRVADAAAVDVGVIQGEAGVPAPHPLGLLPGEVAHVLDRVAEAGRADQGAVAAGEAAL